MEWGSKVAPESRGSVSPDNHVINNACFKSRLLKYYLMTATSSVPSRARVEVKLTARKILVSIAPAASETTRNKQADENLKNCVYEISNSSVVKQRYSLQCNALF